MSRTARAKLAYLTVLLGLLGLVILLVQASGPTLGTGALLAAVLLVPGRVHAVLLRDLFRGRRALERGQPEAARAHLERFLAELPHHPVRRHATWLAGWVYTPSAEAMARNHLAAALLELGQRDEADAELQRALDVDPLYPLPWVQRAVLARADGREADARRAWATARRLGYTATPFGAVVARARELVPRRPQPSAGS